MALELYYTSSPRGLRPGTSGLCTVAMTRSMSAALASRLESLCGYRPPGEGVPIERWPAAQSHWIIDVGGVERHVLAAVRPVKPDHTMRSNTLAHFAVLHQSELDAAGAAWMLAQPETSATSWSGEPRLLSAERAMPRGGPSRARACSTWKAIAGDAGWAGVLANAAMLDPSKPATVICPLGTRALDLIAESMALLPVEYRWRVTFTTYFTQPIAGLRCTWRFCLDGTSAATAARQAGGLVIDACVPQECTRTGEFIDAAREGREPVLAAPAAKARASAKAPAAIAHQAVGGPIALEPDEAADGEERQRTPPRRPVGLDEQDPAAAPAGRTALAVAVVVAVTLLAAVAVLAVLMRSMSQQIASLESRAASAESERDALKGQPDGATTDSPVPPPSPPPDAPPPDALPSDALPSDALPPDALPTAGSAGPTSGDLAAGDSGSGPVAVVMPAGGATRGLRAKRTESVGAQDAAVDESIGPPTLPSVTAMKDETVTVPWPALEGCTIDTVSLSASSALESVGFSVLESATLAFTAREGRFEVAKVASAGSGISWTWLHRGVQKANPALQSAGFEMPRDWPTILQQVRVHATCGGSERQALLGPLRPLSWSIAAKGTPRFDVKLPRLLSTSAVIEWGGRHEPLSEVDSQLQSDAGTIKARQVGQSATAALVMLEWTPSALEQAEIDCISALEAEATAERTMNTRLDLATRALDPRSTLPPLSQAERSELERVFGSWKAEQTKDMDDAGRRAFGARSERDLMMQYRTALDTQLSGARQALVVRKSECESKSLAWRDVLKGSAVLVRPDVESPPIARIEPLASRTVPELPFKGAGAAP